MKSLSIKNANAFLHQIGMELGEWDQVIDCVGKQKKQDNWAQYRAPKDALELFCFSRHVAGWLPKGDWKIFQVDNSTSLDPDEESLFGGLLFGTKEIPNLVENNTFMFEFGGDEDKNDSVELLIANLIFIFLLFECHGYIVS